MMGTNDISKRASKDLSELTDYYAHCLDESAILVDGISTASGLGRSTRSFAACMLPAAPERAAGQPADAGRDRRHRPGRAL
eukprot:SAG22_NODE_513_length_9567_cov_25.867771_11_plen_81_part_00